MRWWILGVVFLVGCGCPGKGNVLAKTGGDAKVIATSKEKSCAIETAKKEATEFCEKKGRKMAVISDNVEYQGVDKKTKAATGAITGLFGSKSDGSRNDDYEATLVFECR